jgi:dUTP pyrophosphatase
MQVKIKKLHEDAIVPKYALANDTGMDIFTKERVVLLPRKVTKVYTGIAIETEKPLTYFIKDKSSVASRGLVSLGGVFDAGYQGEIISIMFNLTDEDIIFEKGQKISQIVFLNIVQPDVVEVLDFENKSERGDNGFGSTGK